MAVPDPLTVEPDGAITGPSPPSDYLSDVLETFPLEIRFAGRLELSSPWSLDVPAGMAMVFTIAQGRCLATADTAPDEIWASAGDVLLLSPGAEHRLRDAARQEPNRGRQGAALSIADHLAASRDLGRVHDPLTLAFGSPPASTVLTGGVFQFDDVQVHPFCWGLPPVVHLPGQMVEGLVPLRGLARQIDDELAAGLPGRTSIVKRLVEILFVAVARRCLATPDEPDEEPIRRLLHPDLGPALALMHRQPEKSWTVAELAERVAMSRSAFAAAFVQVLGRPPLAYLRQRRMELAGRLLRNPSLGLKEVALRVGYDSVSAFNSAFKRHTGVAPGRFRARATS